jgi:hypothetical protein
LPLLSPTPCLIINDNNMKVSELIDLLSVIEQDREIYVEKTGMDGLQYEDVPHISVCERHNTPHFNIVSCGCKDCNK